MLLLLVLLLLLPLLCLCRLAIPENVEQVQRMRRQLGRRQLRRSRHHGSMHVRERWHGRHYGDNSVVCQRRRRHGALRLVQRKRRLQGHNSRNGHMRLRKGERDLRQRS
jgi:hypothetical protein